MTSYSRDIQKSSWKDELRHWLTQSAASVDDFVGQQARRLRRRMGRQGTPRIQSYVGMAGSQQIEMHGRVLTNPQLQPNYHDDRWWDNLANSYRRFASREVPGAKLEITVDEVAGHTTSDEEGYFRLTLPRDEASPQFSFWASGRGRIIAAPGFPGVVEGSENRCDFIAPTSRARFGIISDIDDTIVHTGATDFTTMLKLTVFGNARTRAPIDGVAALYDLMHGDGIPKGEPVNPVFYVSSSPWNLYDLLKDFLDLNGFPGGPIFLRDLGVEKDKFIKRGHGHKLEKARRIMRLFPDLPFVLFGDSGQQDARLYAEAAEEFGQRIRAIFIRDLDPQHETRLESPLLPLIQRAESAGVPMHLVSESTEAARRAIELGLLPDESLSYLTEQTDQDRQRAQGVLTP